MVADSPWTEVKIYSSSFLFVFFFAAIASVGSAKAPEIYSSLLLPSWAPNPSLFGPVWACLYFSMAISLGMFRGRSNWRMHPLIAALFLAQLFLNAAWSWFFFFDENVFFFFFDPSADFQRRRKLLERRLRCFRLFAPLATRPGGVPAFEWTAGAVPKRSRLLGELRLSTRY